MEQVQIDAYVVVQVKDSDRNYSGTVLRKDKNALVLFEENMEDAFRLSWSRVECVTDDSGVVIFTI